MNIINTPGKYFLFVPAWTIRLNLYIWLLALLPVIIFLLMVLVVELMGSNFNELMQPYLHQFLIGVTINFFLFAIGVLEIGLIFMAENLARRKRNMPTLTMNRFGAPDLNNGFGYNMFINLLWLGIGGWAFWQAVDFVLKF